MRTQFPLSGPLSVGDLLDRSFRLYRARFRVFLLTAAVFLVPLAVITGLLTGSFITDYMDAITLFADSPGNATDAEINSLFAQVFGFFGAMLVVALLSMAASGMVTLSLSVQGIEALHGGGLTVGEGIRRGARRFWSYVLMVIVQGLAMFAATIGAVLPIIIVFGALAFGGALAGLSLGETSSAAGIVAAIGLVFVVICGYILMFIVILAPIVYLSARWSVAPAVLVAEELGPLDALRRSWWLTRGNVRRVIGYVVLLYVLVALVVSLPAAVFQQIVLVLMPTSAVGLATSLSTAASSLLSVIGTPFFTAAVVLLYYDLRIRQESYDLELRIQALEAATPMPPPEANAFVPPSVEPPSFDLPPVEPPSFEPPSDDPPPDDSTSGDADGTNGPENPGTRL